MVTRIPVMEDELGGQHAGKGLQLAQPLPVFLDRGSFLDDHQFAALRIAGVDLEPRAAADGLLDLGQAIGPRGHA